MGRKKQELIPLTGAASRRKGWISKTIGSGRIPREVRLRQRYRQRRRKGFAVCLPPQARSPRSLASVREKRFRNPQSNLPHPTSRKSRKGQTRCRCRQFPSPEIDPSPCWWGQIRPRHRLSCVPSRRKKLLRRFLHSRGANWTRRRRDLPDSLPPRAKSRGLFPVRAAVLPDALRVRNPATFQRSSIRRGEPPRRPFRAKLPALFQSEIHPANGEAERLSANRQWTVLVQLLPFPVPRQFQSLPHILLSRNRREGPNRAANGNNGCACPRPPFPRRRPPFDGGRKGSKGLARGQIHKRLWRGQNPPFPSKSWKGPKSPLRFPGNSTAPFRRTPKPRQDCHFGKANRPTRQKPGMPSSSQSPCGGIPPLSPYALPLTFQFYRLTRKQQGNAVLDRIKRFPTGRNQRFAQSFRDRGAARISDCPCGDVRIHLGNQFRTCLRKRLVRIRRTQD